MASAGNGYFPSLEEIMKNGGSSEANNTSRPQKVKNVSPKGGQQGELSLNAAVNAGSKSREKNKAKPSTKGSASEPRKKVKKGDVNRMTEESQSGFSSDTSNPHTHRHRTPKTIPRTKVTAATPVEQRVALNNLRQKLDFDEDKENIEQSTENIAKSSTANVDTMSLSSIATSEIQAGEASELNIGKINDRLVQVRDYLKQATSIYVSLSVAGSHGNKDASRSEQMDKLAKLIQQLRIQEKGYLDLLQKTTVDDKTTLPEELSDSAVPTFSETNNADAESSSEFAMQKQELERLKEQQSLLRKIVDQQKELQQLKERQSALMKIQENAETLIKEKADKEILNNNLVKNKRMQQSDEGRSSKLGNRVSADEVGNSVNNLDDTVIAAEESKRQALESKIHSLQERKEEMDELMAALRNVQTVEANMGTGLNQDDLVEVAAEVAAVAASFTPQDDNSANEMNVNEKITKLNDVRQRLSELKSLVADYELSNPNKASTEASRDNRIQAQAMQKKDGNTVTGAGGARLRLPNVNNQDVVLNDLQALQKGIEELMDNRKRPAPKGREKKKIDVTRNPPSKKLKSKNTNQERGLTADVNEFEAFIKDLPEEYIEKMRELQLARQRVAGNYSPSDKGSNSVITATTQTGESEEESEGESTASSALQWQEDPEFQTKVKKLQMAKEKLHHLQELVKVVQQGGGPNIPVDDLEDLTLTFSDEQDDSSAYGESEEEATEEGEGETGEEEEVEETGEEDIDEQSDNEEQSEASKSTDVNLNFAPENFLADNERRYQGLLRKQRLELNYLLKDRERLLEAQQKLSALATQPNKTTQTQAASKSSQKKKNKSTSIPTVFPTLTEAELSKQDIYKDSPKRNLFSKLEDMSVEPYVGSDQEYQQIVDQSVDKVPLRAPLSNPMAVTEIRRQRELFEQKKKEKFVEKQRKKKLRGDKIQSDDGATYSVPSDIDEGVGVSMYSADVTTAATWGGSTEQSSSGDSAVEEDYGANGGEEEYGSQFDQVEEEEEAVGEDAPPIFKVKKYEEPRRGISWYQDDVRPTKKSLEATPQRGKKKLRQGNLTPAHKLIHDNRRKRLMEGYCPSYSVAQEQPQGQLHTQLATMCTSLLRNEQTLLSMLQNQTRGSQDFPTQPLQNIQSNAYKNIQGFFETQYNESFQQTLHSLRACYERVEQHQLDMEYLRQQFVALNPSTPPVASNTDYTSPWPDPASLHISSFLGGNTTERKPPEANCITEQPVFQKETQTDTTLFEDPFKNSIQQYSLFGGDTSTEVNKSPGKKTEEEFNFTPNVVAVSPGAIGDRSFQPPFEEEEVEVDSKFPYRLRMSEYNPMSFQCNFPIAPTGNTVTMSRLSMKKDHAETILTDGPEKSIWPSFFKITDSITHPDNSSERSSKCASSFAGHSNEHCEKILKTSDKAEEVLKDMNHTDFDRLRDSIYSEVATLIAMNEARPHYLIELFRELQLLNSDYLRQRSLFSLHELVTRFLTDEGTSPSKAAFKQETIPVTSTQSFENWVASTSEQTPSESAVTTDDESESLALQTLARQIQNNEIYDYAELADSQSEGNISTPGSQNEHPFAAENLGNTVINLDEALQKMKIYEQNMAKAKKTFEEISQNVRESTPAVHNYNQKEAIENIKYQISNTIDTISNSSAGDVTSETSSDMPQPSFDTQKLDRQIKSVMRDLIPFLNEHIESICNEELLDEIRNLIVHFAKQKEPCSEKEQFGKFFHTQLDSILRGSLMKFNARKLKECGEDILIDVSEILFNELSFFKLMQDLNRPLYNGTASELHAPQDGDNSQSKMPFLNQEREVDGSAEGSSTAAGVCVHTKTASHSSTSSSNTYVVVDPAVDITDDETESQRQFVNVELSVSETRPIRSSGSGEDDNEEEPSTFSKVSVPASSILQYSLQSSSSNDHAAEGSASNDQQVVVQGAVDNQLQQLLQGAVEDEDEDQEEMVEDDRDEGDQDEGTRREEEEQVEEAQSDLEVREDERSEHEREAEINASPEADGTENESAEDQRDFDSVAEAESSAVNQESEAEGQGDEAAEDDNNQENEAAEDDNQGEQDDLPEADMLSEDNVALAGVVLAHLEGQPELAGSAVVMPPTLANSLTS